MTRLDGTLQSSQRDVLEKPVWTVRLHWCTVGLVTVAFCAALGREQVEARALREALLLVHQVSGVSVCLLCIVRLVRRWIAAPLPVGAPESAWAGFAAVVVHAALYVAMVGVPLLGWSLSTAAGRVPPWLVRLPTAWVPEDEDLADRLSQWHHIAAYVWLALIGLHVAAALWHHLVLRDSVLRVMRPR